MQGMFIAAPGDQGPLAVGNGNEKRLLHDAYTFFTSIHDQIIFVFLLKFYLVSNQIVELICIII